MQEVKFIKKSMNKEQGGVVKRKMGKVIEKIKDICRSNRVV